MQKKINFMILAAVFVCACGAGVGQSSEAKLKEALFFFNEGVRWGRVQNVLSRVDPGSMEHFVEMHKEFGREIQITDYEIVSTTLIDDKKRAKAEAGIEITWYRLANMEVKNTLVIQHWEERDREWFMVAEEYRSGDVF